MERAGAQHVAQRGLSQQAGRVVRVGHVGHGNRGVGHAVVDDSVYRYRHTVFGQHLNIHRTINRYSLVIPVLLQTTIEVF